MKIATWDEKAETTIPRGMCVTFRKDEAMEIIASLANQLNRRNSNSMRTEWTDTPVGYFTIVVDMEERA